MSRALDTPHPATCVIGLLALAIAVGCAPARDGGSAQRDARSATGGPADGAAALGDPFAAMLEAADSGEVRADIRRCENGEAEACYRLGDRYRRGDGVPEDRRRAVRLHGRACARGSVRACHDVGMRYFQGLGVERNLQAARIYLERACAERSGESCHVLGRMGEEEIGGIWSEERTRRLFWRACHVGYRRDCLREEVMLRPVVGEREARLPADAPERLVEAAGRCDGGLPVGCWVLFRAYETGRGVERDAGAAESLRQTACRWGVRSACYGGVTPVGAAIEPTSE